MTATMECLGWEMPEIAREVDFAGHLVAHRPAGVSTLYIRKGVGIQLLGER